MTVLINLTENDIKRKIKQKVIKFSPSAYNIRIDSYTIHKKIRWSIEHIYANAKVLYNTKDSKIQEIGIINVCIDIENKEQLWK